MRITLKGGSYEAPSLIAGAQRCVNLYPEAVPGDEDEVAMVHYPTPGLRLLVNQTVPAPGRGLYRASNGQLYATIGATLYFVLSDWSLQAVGTIPGSGPVRMIDNGISAIAFDGSGTGWTIDLATQSFGLLNTPGFYGAVTAAYLDTYFVVSKPNTPQFNVSDSLSIAFGALSFANKSGGADNLVGLIAMHRELWLIGVATTEVWVDSGASDFPFQIMPGAFIEHGCVAPYSIAKSDRAIFWLARDDQGQGIVVRGGNYNAQRISTHAIEAQIANYSVISDAVGWTQQTYGHVFYWLTFPTADATWVYDMATGLWHERVWLDVNGNEHRHRAAHCAFGNGETVILDWENGSLYALDPAVFTDNGLPIKRVRAFPHLMTDARRVVYKTLIADMEVGEDVAFDDPQLTLRCSDDRGRTYNLSQMQSMGRQGDYLTSVQFQRLGMARDRIFELSWSAPIKTALIGAFVQSKAASS